MFLQRVRNFFTSTMVILFLAYLLPSFALATETASPNDNNTTTKNTVEMKEDTSWIHLPSSVRPAYVGIHGGTAPVTLLRDTDGLIYAITGQTGNDFILAIRSGNASNQKKQTPLTTPEDNELNARVITPEPSKDYFLSLMEEYEASSSDIYMQWSDSTQWIAVIVAAVNKEEHSSQGSDEIIAPKPKDYPFIVFASEDDMKLITKDSKEFSAFGFSDNDMPTATELNGTQALRFTPLELSDYRSILGNLF